jgi:hypothetical protein
MDSIEEVSTFIIKSKIFVVVVHQGRIYQIQNKRFLLFLLEQQAKG